MRALPLLVLLIVLGVAPAAPAQIPLPLPTPTASPAPGPQPADPPVVDADGSGDAFTTAAGGATHANAVTGTVAAPLGLLWKQDFEAYRLLAANGLVIAAGPRLVAFDAATGTPRWSVAASAWALAIVGDVVVVTEDTQLRAFALADGAQRWVSGQARYGVPVPAGDLVLTQSLEPRQITAREAATGTERWSVGAGNPGTPTVVGERVYVPLCQGGFKVLERSSGREIGVREAGCTGGVTSHSSAVGRTVRIDREFAYKTDDLSQVARVEWQAARPGLGLLSARSDQVAGVDPLTGSRRWMTTVPVASGSLLLAGDSAVNVSSSGVAVLDAATGALRWAGRYSEPVYGGSSDGRVPMAASGGSLFIAKGRTLLALRGGATAPPGRLSATIPRFRVVQYGRAFTVSGAIIQSPIITGHDVSIAERAYPRLRVRSRVIDRTTLDDMGFRATFRPEFSTEYVLGVRGIEGLRQFTAVVVPRERSRIRRNPRDPNALTLRVDLEAPRSVSLRGRRYGIYVARAGAKRYQRLAIGRIGATGRGRGRVTVRLRAPRLGRRDFIRSCVSGVSARGMGFHDRLDRACGAASVRF